MSFKPSQEIVIKAEYTLSTNTNNRRHKHHVAANGELLVSKQELQIYNYLLEHAHFHIEYEAPYRGSDKTLFPDFTVLNLTNNAFYIWEHLGMTNSDKYLDQIPAKLSWYAENGLRSIEQGGNLILTFYKERTFFHDIEEVVKKLII